MANNNSFRINIAITAIHKLTDRILDVGNAFQNTIFSIYKILYVITPPYYLEWFEKYHPNVPLNQYYGSFPPQCMNINQVTKIDGQQCNRILDAVVTIVKYRKIEIDHAINSKHVWPYLLYYSWEFS